MPTTNEILPFIEKINDAIQQNSIRKIASAFYKLGKYLQSEYPNQKLENIEKMLAEQGVDFSDLELPDLEMVSFLIAAREELADQGVVNEERKKYLEAQLIGINIYLSVMDKPPLKQNEESAITKEFNAIGDIVKVFPEVAKKNTELALQVLLDLETAQDKPKPLEQEDISLTSLASLKVFPEQVSGLRELHLNQIETRKKIPLHLMGQSPENIDQIGKITRLLSLLTKKSINFPELKKQIDPFVKKMEKLLIEHYSSKQDFKQQIAFSTKMNALLQNNKDLILKMDKHIFSHLIRINPLPEELEKMSHLTKSLDELEQEAQLIDERNPGRKNILTFVETTKAQLNSYYSGSRTPSNRRTLENNINKLIEQVEGTVESYPILNAKMYNVFSILRDILSFGLYSKAKTGQWGMYQTSVTQKTIESTKQVTQSLKQQLEMVKLENNPNDSASQKDDEALNENQQHKSPN